MNDAELARLYEQHGFAVHRRCLRLLGSASEADDALQEVFLRVMRYGREGPKEQSTLAWLYRIADHHCFDVLAKKKRRNTELSANPEPGAAKEARPGSGPEQTRLVAELLAGCKPRLRDVAVLYYIDEMTQDEVAEAVGVSRKTVKERLAEFLAAARRLLEVKS